VSQLVIQTQTITSETEVNVDLFPPPSTQVHQEDGVQQVVGGEDLAMVAQSAVC